MFDHIQLPPEVEACLERLRSRIRQYVLWEGLALAVVLVGLFFWFSLGLDWAVFSVRRLEPPRWLRVGLDVAVLGGLVAVGLLLILFRVFRSFRSKSLALILERRFPELGDRLVTAVELSSQPEARSALTSAMLERTVAEASEKLRQLDVGSVFDRRPLRRAMSAASLLLVSLVAFGVMCPQAFARWRAGYLGLEETYWPRDVDLVATVLALPGDRVKSFVDGEYKHPRGSDLVLMFDVPAGKKVPERVDLQYKLGGGRGYGRATCFAAGERRFKHAIDDLLDDADFWVTAGDFTNREAYRVRVVDPPRVDVLTAESLFPEHTKRITLDEATKQPVRETVSVQGTQMSLPIETDFLLRAKSNKPLVRARLQYGLHELSLSPTEASLTTRSADGQSLQVEPISADRAAKFFDAARREFVVPFVLSELATPASRERFEKLNKPFAMPPDVALKIFLEDTDDIIGADPARITIHGIADNAPVIAAELNGIGTSVTRKAEIPVAALITDDYGIKYVRFEFQIDDKEPWETRSLTKTPSGEPREFKLQTKDDDPTERFEILMMDLEIGQKLTLTVVAELSEPDEYEVLIYDADRGRRLVAAIELVSPENKDRPGRREVFTGKVLGLMQQGVCVSIVDPVTIRQFNLCSDVLRVVGQTDSHLGAPPPETYAVTLRSRKQPKKQSLLDVWFYPMVVGQPLPTLPIWLTPELHVMLPLEPSYQETCRLLRIA